MLRKKQIKIIFNSLTRNTEKEEIKLLKLPSNTKLDKKSQKFLTLQKKQSYGKESIKNSDLYIKIQ